MSLVATLKRWLAGRPKRPEHLRRGEAGERAAEAHLRQQGLKFLARNYRSNRGEIDLVFREGDCLAFVEVKTREEDDPMPEEQVNLAKQHQLTRAARTYMSRFGSPQPPARFDVIGIVWPPGGSPRIRHTTDAFEATF